MAPTVSIILPVFDSEVSLEGCLQSIAREPYRDYELIIVDDGSTDGTERILDQWKRESYHIKVIRHRKNRGIIDALHTAMDHARGDYLARIDSDDIWHPRLEQQVRLLEEHSQLAVAGGLVSYETEDPAQSTSGFRDYVAWQNSLVGSDSIRTNRFVESPLCHPSVLIRRIAYNEVGGYVDCDWAEDYDLWLRLLQAGWEVGKVPSTVVTWRDHRQRLTRIDSRYSQENFIECKAHYLSQERSIQRKGVAICGKGKIGKRFAIALRNNNIHIDHFLDIKESLAGVDYQGIPVKAAKELQPWRPDAPIYLVALGQPNRREAARVFFVETGYDEGTGFFCVT